MASVKAVVDEAWVRAQRVRCCWGCNKSYTRMRSDIMSQCKPTRVQALLTEAEHLVGGADRDVGSVVLFGGAGGRLGNRRLQESSFNSVAEYPVGGARLYVAYVVGVCQGLAVPLAATEDRRGQHRQLRREGQQRYGRSEQVRPHGVESGEQAEGDEAEHRTSFYSLLEDNGRFQRTIVGLLAHVLPGEDVESIVRPGVLVGQPRVGAVVGGRAPTRRLYWVRASSSGSIGRRLS